MDIDLYLIEIKPPNESTEFFHLKKIGFTIPEGTLRK
jgi:hypothetical protein